VALSQTLSTFAGDPQAVKEIHFEWIPDAFSVDFFRDGQKKDDVSSAVRIHDIWRYPHIVCKDTYSNGMIVVNLKAFKVFFFLDVWYMYMYMYI